MVNPSIVFAEYTKLLVSNDGRLEKLEKYADKVLRFKKINDRALTAEDVIQEIITKLAYGERTWNVDSEPDLYSFLFMLIKSHIYNYSYDEERVLKPKRSKDQEKEEARFRKYVEHRSLIKPPDLEKAVETLLTSDSCLQLFIDDPACSRIIMRLTEGLQRKEIAKNLGVTLKEVNAALKRIKRKLKPVIKDYKKRETYNSDNFHYGYS